MAGTLRAADAPSASRPLWLRVVRGLSTLCGWAAATMIAAAVGVTCQMIFVRYVLNESTVWQTEAVTYLALGATLIGLSYVQMLRGHVNVDLFPMLLPRRARFLLAVLVSGLSLAVIGLMAFYGYEMWHEAWSRGWTSDTVWAIKLWIPYAVVPIGFGLFWLQLFADFVALLTGVEAPFGLDPSAADASEAR